jgi:hypothetical protein
LLNDENSQIADGATEINRFLCAQSQQCQNLEVRIDFEWKNEMKETKRKF